MCGRREHIRAAKLKPGVGGLHRRLVAIGLVGLLGGCIDSLPHSRLPELAKDPRPVLTPDQQKAAVSEQGAKRSSKRDEVMKEIEEKR